MKEAQAGLTKLCRSGKRFVIANRGQPVVVAMPVEDFEALMDMERAGGTTTKFYAVT